VSQPFLFSEPQTQNDFIQNYRHIQAQCNYTLTINPLVAPFASPSCLPTFSVHQRMEMTPDQLRTIILQYVDNHGPENAEEWLPQLVKHGLPSHPPDPIDSLASEFEAKAQISTQPTQNVSSDRPVYFERQRLSLCLLHSLNNLVRFVFPFSAFFPPKSSRKAFFQSNIWMKFALHSHQIKSG
jgi:hypothetical protein